MGPQGALNIVFSQCKAVCRDAENMNVGIGPGRRLERPIRGLVVAT